MNTLKSAHHQESLIIELAGFESHTSKFVLRGTFHHEA